MPELPPPELLEQLGIEPHCMRSGGQQPQPEPASVREGPDRTTPLIIKPASAKENPVRDIATATLSGNLTCDVELRTLPSGTDVARVRVARSTRPRSGEEGLEKTNYYTVEAYGPQARACAQYLAKGSRVVVEAELDWREWTDQQNNKREAVTFKARQVLFEGTRLSTGNGDESGADPRSARPGAEPVAASTATDEPASADDLPF